MAAAPCAGAPGPRSLHPGTSRLTSLASHSVKDSSPRLRGRAAPQPRGRYRRRAQRSPVDEELFGEHCEGGGSDPSHHPFLQRLGSSSPIVILQEVPKSPGALPPREYKPKTTRIITKDEVRDLVIPEEKPPTSLIIEKKEYERIKKATGTLSQEDRGDRLRALQARQDAAFEALIQARKAEQRKAELQDKMEHRADLEEEQRQRDEKLLQRARRMRLEQEEEMKELTALFFNTKCNMIRDKQVLEKQLIKKELEEEELRLDKMMEMERLKGLEMQDELERLRKEELIRARQGIIKQMEQNAEERALKEEQKYQEGQRELQRLEQMRIEDQKAWKKRQEELKQIYAEIKHINDESQRLKEQQQEQERLEDERLLQYQQQQMEREAAMEAEQERIRLEREKELARMRAVQEQSLDWQAEQDALRAKRNQEAADREWRRQELEKARRRAEQNQQLRRDRLEQVAQQERVLAMQVERDRQEFQRLLRVQQEQRERQQLEQARWAELQRAHAEELRQQIQERQQQREQERLAFLEEGRRQQREAQQRSQCLAQLGHEKLQEFRATGIPEKYCAQVERKAGSRVRPTAT